MRVSLKHLVVLGVLLCVLLPSTVLAAEDDWAYTSSWLDIDLRLGSEIELRATDDFPEASLVSAELTFQPVSNERQDVLSFQSVPEAASKDGNLLFTWKNPSVPSILPFYWKAKVRTEYGLVRVDKKISFPLDPDDLEGLESYLLFTENIDIDDDIRDLGQQLAEGEDDLYVLVFKISEWLKENIEYNLDFAETLEKSTATLQTRQGVCDEFTALFVSILRSLGVPTKYVSGYAYTNLKTPAGFGPHAWAEVYFPGKGWVPFDITYNEFGFVDASHIKLKDSFDSGTYSTRYEWRGRYMDLRSSPLDFTANVLTVGEANDQRVSLKSSFAKSEVGFGSYNLLEVEATNLNNFYTGMTLYVTKSDLLEFPEGNTRDILLRPYETKKVFWIVHMEGSLNQNFQYQIPVRAYLTDGVTSEATFTSMAKKQVFTSEEMEKLRDFSLGDKARSFSQKLDLDCDVDDEHVLVGKPFGISCVVRNAGNVQLDIPVCVDTDCQDVHLGIAQSKTLHFSKEILQVGERELYISASVEGETISTRVVAEVKDAPVLAIQNISAPLSTVYDEKFRIEFLLHRESIAMPEHVYVTLSQDGEDVRSWEVEALSNDRRFILDHGGWLLQEGTNLFLIQVSYDDGTGQVYSSEGSFTVRLTDVTLIQKAYLFAARVGKGKSSFDFLVLVLFAFALGGVAGFILKGVRHIRSRHHARHIKEHLVDETVLPEKDTVPDTSHDASSLAEEVPLEEEATQESEESTLKPPTREEKHTKKHKVKSEAKAEESEEAPDVVESMKEDLEKNIKKRYKELEPKKKS